MNDAFVLIGLMSVLPWGCTTRSEEPASSTKLLATNHEGRIVIAAATVAGDGCRHPGKGKVAITMFKAKPTCKDPCDLDCQETHPADMLIFYLDVGPDDSAPRQFDSPSCYALGNEGCGMDSTVQLMAIDPGTNAAGSYELVYANGTRKRGDFKTTRWCGEPWAQRDCPRSH